MYFLSFANASDEYITLQVRSANSMVFEQYCLYSKYSYCDQRSRLSPEVISLEDLNANCLAFEPSLGAKGLLV